VSLGSVPGIYSCLKDHVINIDLKFNPAISFFLSETVKAHPATRD